jgi:hypothetical protein
MATALSRASSDSVSTSLQQEISASVLLFGSIANHSYAPPPPPSRIPARLANSKSNHPRLMKHRRSSSTKHAQHRHPIGGSAGAWARLKQHICHIIIWGPSRSVLRPRQAEPNSLLCSALSCVSMIGCHVMHIPKATLPHDYSRTGYIPGARPGVICNPSIGPLFFLLFWKHD